jgi:hypothetical protein
MPLLGRTKPLTSARFEEHKAFADEDYQSLSARFHREAVEEIIRLQGYQELLKAVLRRVRRNLQRGDPEAEAIDRLL